MQDDYDDACQQLLRDAALVGMSEREIVDCFSEWLLIHCWRFDGRDFRVFGNFRGTDDVVDVVEEGEHTSFQGTMGNATRAHVLSEIFGTLQSRRTTSIHFAMPLEDGALRDFVSIAAYKPLPDGSDGLIGVTYEDFKPLRQVAFEEARESALSS